MSFLDRGAKAAWKQSVVPQDNEVNSFQLVKKKKNIEFQFPRCFAYFILATVLHLPLCCNSGFAVCNLSVKPITLIYTSAAPVQFISLATKKAILFWCCDFFIIGIYLGTVTVVQSMLAASPGEKHGRSAATHCSGKSNAFLPLPWEPRWHAKHS